MRSDLIGKIKEAVNEVGCLTFKHVCFCNVSFIPSFRFPFSFIVARDKQAFDKAREASEAAFDRAEASLREAQQKVELSDEDLAAADAKVAQAGAAGNTRSLYDLSTIRSLLRSWYAVNKFTEAAAAKAANLASAENDKRRKEAAAQSTKRAFDDAAAALRRAQQKVIDARNAVNAARRRADTICSFSRCRWSVNSAFFSTFVVVNSFFVFVGCLAGGMRAATPATLVAPLPRRPSALGLPL